MVPINQYKCYGRQEFTHKLNRELNRESVREIYIFKQKEVAFKQGTREGACK